MAQIGQAQKLAESSKGVLSKRITCKFRLNKLVWNSTAEPLCQAPAALQGGLWGLRVLLVDRRK